MKNKNEIRNQILLRFVNKSNQVIKDIDKLTSHIYTTHQNIDNNISLASLHSLHGNKN